MAASLSLVSTGFSKTNDELDFPEGQIRMEKKKKWGRVKHPIIDWMCWNGIYLFAYGCSIAGVLCGLLSPLLNMHQGGNLYPYFSEVIRSGIVKRVFFVGCSVGLIPTLIFTTNYFITMMRYKKTFKSLVGKIVFTVMEFIQLILCYYSAFSVIGVAFCDMDNFPDEHTLFSSTWVFFTNLMEVIQFIQVKSTIYKGKRNESLYIVFKACLSLFSVIGMINFVILGSYRPCHSRNMKLSRCLLEFDETYCFSMMVDNYKNRHLVKLRTYDHCPILHYVRGVGEFVSVVCTMFYLTTMVYDIKNVRLIVEEGKDNSIGIRDDVPDSCV